MPDLPRRSFLRAGLAAAAGSALARSSAVPSEPAEFSFLMVSDTHFTALESAPETLEPEVLAVNTRLIDLLNRLPGTASPAPRCRSRWAAARWRSAKEGGIPVFGCRASGARGVNRGMFHCSVKGSELVIRELACLKNPTGWLPGDATWVNQWKVPLRRGSVSARRSGLVRRAIPVKVGRVKPYVQLAEARLRDGTVFSLHTHDGKFYLKNDRRELMSTALTYSEQLLAELGCADLLDGQPSRPKHPRVLIGGLGMGFTLKRTLELVGRPATVEVAELVPEIIEWNRTFLSEHNGPILADERTRIYQGDLFDCLAGRGKTTYDAILIDIDDGPDMLITEGNSRLYSPGFLTRIRDALAPGGCVAYWLALPNADFVRGLNKAGFTVEEHLAKPHANSKRPRHRIYVARRK